jgi:hypothetical protein
MSISFLPLHSLLSFLVWAIAMKMESDTSAFFFAIKLFDGYISALDAKA